MALSLGIKVGSLFRVAKASVRVKSIGPGQRAVLDVDGREFMVTEEEATEILPQVMVSMGNNPSSSPKGSRLAFQAPRSIPILRGTA